MNQNNAFWIFVGVLSILSIIVAIADLTVARVDRDNDCQGHDKSGIDLSSYLIVSGITDIGCILCIWLFIVAASEIDSLYYMPLVLGIIYEVFKVIWLLVGIVILVRSHRACINQGEDLGVMTLVCLGFNQIPFLAVTWLFCKLIKWQN